MAVAELPLMLMPRRCHLMNTKGEMLISLLGGDNKSRRILIVLQTHYSQRQTTGDKIIFCYKYLFQFRYSLSVRQVEPELGSLLLPLPLPLVAEPELPPHLERQHLVALRAVHGEQHRASAGPGAEGNQDGEVEGKTVCNSIFKLC